METKKLNKYNRINNVLITYAFNTADEIRKTAQEIQDRIRDEQPKSSIPNRCLNIAVNTEYINIKVRLLKEIEELSTYIYRVNQGLDKPDKPDNLPTK